MSVVNVVSEEEIGQEQTNDESRVVLGSNTGFHHLLVKEQRKLTLGISISL